jgi:G:T/U-mismatch repair DNA glycosylase
MGRIRAAEAAKSPRPDGRGLFVEKREGEKREFISEQRHHNIVPVKSQLFSVTIHEMFTGGSKTIQNPRLTKGKIRCIVSTLKVSMLTTGKRRE